MSTYGLGIEAAKRIKEGRGTQYTKRRPEVFEQLTTSDLVSILKMKALRTESFNMLLEDVTFNADALTQLDKLKDEVVDIINYADMIYCKLLQEEKNTEDHTTIKNGTTKLHTTGHPSGTNK